MPVPTVRSCSDAVSSNSRSSGGKRRRRSGTRSRMRATPSRAQIRRDAAGNDPVHHQPVAETRGGGAQHLLAQHAAMRQHQAERGIVADGTEIAEVVGDPLQLRHHPAQRHRARRHIDTQGPPPPLGRTQTHRRRWNRRRCGRRCAAARGIGRTLQQRLDALVHVAQALLQPHHGFAIGGEAEVAGLDDAGMHRTDRDLVQAVAFHRQERVVGRGLVPPASVVQPGTRIRQPDRIQPEQVAHRALQPDRRRMQAAH